MVQLFFTLLFIFVSTFGYANTTLKNRLTKSKQGDYIVTAQGSNYSLLLIRQLENKKLILEEVVIEQNLVDLKKVSWKTWIEKKAPGASSWTAYAIDLEKNTLSQCFNHFLKQWVFIEKSDYFFAQLLTLSLQPTRDNLRKRIGPSPMPGEIDRRKMWNPQMVREGKKVRNPSYEVVRCTWPNDNTRVASCVFELYLDADNTSFPFPFWMEVQSPHYTFKMRAVDSGSGINSPMPLLQ